MRVSMYFDLRNPPAWERPWASHYARTLDTIEEAERLGAATVWFSEHHFFEDGYLPQPLTFAAAVAARTKRVRIGTAIMLPALRPAIQLAEEAAIVDLLSAGRLELGLGAGYRVPEYAAFGVNLAERYAITEQRIAELRQLWADGTPTPQPIQHPVPLWGGFFGPRGARIAGRQGMGLLSADPALLEPYREALLGAGHDPALVRMAEHQNIVLADDPEAAWPRIAPHLKYQWETYRHYMVEGTGAPEPKPVDPEKWRSPGPNGEPARFAVMTPEECAAFLRQRAEGVPFVEAYFWTSIAGMPEDVEQRHVELVCTRLRELVADV